LVFSTVTVQLKKCDWSEIVAVHCLWYPAAAAKPTIVNSTTTAPVEFIDNPVALGEGT
jgi:hypothetical protein